MWVYQYRDRIALESLERTEWPDPQPGPHDIVIQMGAVALNHRDIALARGHYHISVQPPLVPLSDGAGRVVQIGRADEASRPSERNVNVDQNGAALEQQEVPHFWIGLLGGLIPDDHALRASEASVAAYL